jgi:hypothetical protein
MAALSYSRSKFFGSRASGLRVPEASTRRAAVARRPTDVQETAARVYAVACNALLCLWALLAMAFVLAVVAGFLV